YHLDTLGTRLGLEHPANGVLLSKIGEYRNVIWLVDTEGAILDALHPPITVLRAMSGPGLASTLAAYTQLGGRVWLTGGGAAYASLAAFNKTTNDPGSTTVFSSSPQFNELAPSRLMYDAAHWQSSIASTKGGVRTSRYEPFVRF